MEIKTMLNKKELTKLKQWMQLNTGNYQVYDPFVLPILADETSLAFKKQLDLGYTRKDFEGKTVSDLGCCLGFFTFLSLYLGAEKSIGYDNNPKYISFGKEVANNYEKIFPQFKDRVQFKKLNILSFPEIEVTDILLVNSIIHWFFISDKTVTMSRVLEWLHQQCSEAVFFEGCINTSDPSLAKYGVCSSRYNSNLFLEEANRIFSKVEIIEQMSYSKTRIKVRLFK